MLLRLLVSNFVQQTAKQRLFEAVSDAVQGTAGNTSREKVRTDSSGAPLEDGEDNEAVPLPPCEVAILFALSIESGGMVDLLQDRVTSKCATFVEHDGFVAGKRIVVAETGVGQAAAQAAAEDILKTHRPTWLISAGFAGALQENLRRGHIVISDCVATTDGTAIEISLGFSRESVANQRSLHIGRLITVDQLVRSEAEKRALGQTHNAIACDMETIAVAAACQAANTRFLSVRIITDAVDDQLPPEVEKLLHQKSWAGKLGAAAGAIVNRPSSVKDMWNLREEALKSTDRLAKFLVGVIDQLR